MRLLLNQHVVTILLKITFNSKMKTTVGVIWNKGSTIKQKDYIFVCKCKYSETEFYKNTEKSYNPV